LPPTPHIATLDIMRREFRNAIRAAMSSVVLMLVPIFNACIPDDDLCHRLSLPAKLLLLPGFVLLRPLQSAPEIPILVFTNWLLFTALLWPIVAMWRRER
jgi:hypothetical protein